MVTVAIHLHGDVFRVVFVPHLHENALLAFGREADARMLEVGRWQTLRLVERVLHHVVGLEVDAHLWQNTQRMNENKPKI